MVSIIQATFVSVLLWHVRPGCGAPTTATSVASTGAPWQTCLVQSGSPCAGIVYEPETWCAAFATNTLWATITGKTGSAACEYTASPTSVVTLGIKSKYIVDTIPSCASSLSLSLQPNSTSAPPPTSTAAPAALATTQAPTSAPGSCGGNVTQFSSIAHDLENTYGSPGWRAGNGIGSAQDTSTGDGHLKNLEVAGAFGSAGLLTAIVADVVFFNLAVPTTVAWAGLGVALGFTSIAALGIAALMAAVAFGVYELVKFILGFHNNNDNNWPLYDLGTTKNNGVTVDATWSVRVFSDEGCGNTPVYGGNPYKQDHNNVPVMMTEYLSTDLHYSDGQPCQSLMINKKHTVSSAAVWISKTQTDISPGFIFLYSHPLCQVTRDPRCKTDAAPNGTFPLQPNFAYPDYMQIYNGSAPRYNAGNDYKEGQWQCYKGRWASMTVLFPNVTDVCTDPGYTITPANTVPVKSVASDRGAIMAKQPFMTTDITETWQQGTQLDVNLFPGSGRPGRGYDPSICPNM